MVADTANHIVEEIVLATCIVLKGNNYHVFLANVKRFFTIVFTAVFLIIIKFDYEVFVFVSQIWIFPWP